MVADYEEERTGIRRAVAPSKGATIGRSVVAGAAGRIELNTIVALLTSSNAIPVFVRGHDSTYAAFEDGRNGCRELQSGDVNLETSRCVRRRDDCEEISTSLVR